MCHVFLSCGMDYLTSVSGGAMPCDDDYLGISMNFDSEPLSTTTV